MREIELTVLTDYHLGYGARAYLHMLHERGLRPKMILRTAFTRSRNVKRVARYLGTKKAYDLFEIYKRLKSGRKKAYLDEMKSDICSSIGCSEGLFDEIDPEKYCSRSRVVYTDSYRDGVFIDAVRSLETRKILYAGSGIVPKEVLDIPGVEILHIHPGIVPDIRGSDGMLYSILLKGRPGYSCFYMDDGIDTGDLIHTKEFSPLRVELGEDYPDNMIYEGLLAFADSYFRALTLMETLDRFGGVSRIVSVPQDRKEGRTYYTMHPRLVSAVIRGCIVS
jgi:hypothetical protein